MELRPNPYRFPAGLCRRNRPRAQSDSAGTFPALLSMAALPVSSPFPLRPVTPAESDVTPAPGPSQTPAGAAPVIVAGPGTPRIVSTAHGAMKHLLLTYPAYAADEYSYRNVYTDLLAKLPPTTRYTIVAHASVIGDLQAAVETAGAIARTTIVQAPDYLDFTVWAEDPFVAVQDIAVNPPVSYLVEPFMFTRDSDGVIADLAVQSGAVRATQSPLYFQGGNILIGDNFVLIGADYPATTLKYVKRYESIAVPDATDSGEFVKQLYQRTFDPNRSVSYVGTASPLPQSQRRPILVSDQAWQEEVYGWTGDVQPIFHIDMFISLAGRAENGKYRLIVGSPAEAARILGQPVSPYALNESFDELATQLAAQGFEIIRNPLPLTYVDYPDERLRSWYFATANNCLVQIDATGNAVWLPTYGHGLWADLGAIDAENRRIWERLGFTVHELADFHPFAQNMGSVHCIKKFIER